MSFTAAWIDLDIIILSEVSQKDKYHVTSLICGIFLDQGSCLCPLHWQADSYPLCRQGKWKVKVTQSCPTLCDPMGYTVHGILQARILQWVAVPFSRGSSLFQGIFPTQGLNPGLLHCGWIFYQLSHKGSPRKLEWVAYAFFSRSSQPRNQTGICTARGFFTSVNMFWINK